MRSNEARQRAAMHDPTTPAAIAEKYDALRYDALPYPVSHPDHVAAVVTMFGLEPPPVATARVLEVGCNDGSNLLPMAATLPDATFVGCDIAASAISKAHEGAQALGLANVRLEIADLAAIEGGAFDYIVAHGVYSWVPAPVRDALFALASRALARNGILFTSYNTYPGGYVRRAAWEALRWHVAGLPDRPSQLRAARELADLLGEPGTTHDAADAAVRAEFKRIAGEPDSPLFHDTLAEPNDPVWFHEFVDHAGRHGLVYVAEALPSMMAGGGLAPRVRQFLATQGRLAREQYLDFARVRRFRQSLLCRSEATGDFQLAPARLRGLHVSASMPLLRAASEGKLPATPGADGVVLRALLDRLVAIAPAAMPTSELVERMRSEPGARPVEAILLDAWVSGFAQLHAHPPHPAVSAGPRPRAFLVARWQAKHREGVTNLRHETIRLVDPFARALLPLCDGARDRAALASAMAAVGQPAAPMQLDDTLATFARLALLERD
jgi:SAM-dependent methyltransferase